MSKVAIVESFEKISTIVIDAVSQGETYTRLVIAISLVVIAYIVTEQIRKSVPSLKMAPENAKQHAIKDVLYRSGKLLFPIFAIIFLRTAVEIYEDNWVMHTAIAASLLLFFDRAVNLVVTQSFAASAFRWVGIPIIFFHLVGVLDDTILLLDSIAFEAGNIKLSVYGVVRLVIFGSLLFWLGRFSNSTAQSIIRKQQKLESRTREMLAKMLEIGLFTLFFIIMLNMVGISLTTLTIFGGALGVGLGFGLQAIASNFISGVIILLDRSVSQGDYIELEDGRTGIVTHLNMRSTTLETFDGKDIVVPNEKFITSSFTNWTQKNFKQRYRVDFSVAYDTDVRALVELVKEAVSAHPQVLCGDKVPVEERPDCEIGGFGDSGINMFVEFWIDGIDDGKNRVGGDLYMIILETLQANGIEIPYPQREVRMLGTAASKGV